MTILYFIIALGLLVFIHEFGHFLMAKKQGIGVEKFSLGFGPKLLGLRRGETHYMISALPLGGYVKLRGEEPEEGAEKDEKSYSQRPIRHRFAVVFAGPFMNLLLALTFMPAVFLLGRMEPVYLDQRPVAIGIKKESPAEKIGLKKGDEILAIDRLEPKNWRDLLDFILIHGGKEVDLRVKRGKKETATRVRIAEAQGHQGGFLGIEPLWFAGNEPVIDDVSPKSPAAIAGLAAGDEVLKIDQVPVQSWTEMSERVGAGEGKKIAVTVKRGDTVVTVSVVPRFDEGMKKWLIGVRKDVGKGGGTLARKKYSVGEAIVRGTRENIKLTGLTFAILGRLVTGDLSYKTLGGPIRIAQASAIAAKSGLADFLYFLAFLSLQLGILNLLPFPVLDGGHLLFFGIEGVRRRPVPVRIRQTADQIGFFLLLFLMLLVTLNDVNSVWGFQQILEKVRSLF